MERNFLAGSVKANHVKNRVTVVKNVGGTVGKRNKKLVFHLQGLCLHTQVGNAARVNANNRAVCGIAIKKAIGNKKQSHQKDTLKYIVQ